MDVKDIFQYDWSYLLPEFIILGFATLLSLLDLFAGKRLGKQVIGWLSLVGVVLAAVFVFVNVNTLDKPYSYMADMIRIDDYGNAFKLLFLAGTSFALLISLSYLKKGDVQHSGEYYYLLLTGLLGAMVMASSADLITLFVGLELLSLSSYVLVGLRKKSLQSNESAFKYVVSGGIATAITLFGMSYIYGLTGTTHIYEISMRLAEAGMAGYQFLVYVAFAFLVVGLAFKISAAPFHMWTPDVYQGAPTPITAFLAVVSKAAGFSLLFRVVMISFFNVTDGVGRFFFQEGSLYLGLMAAASMIIGNTMALRQTNVKRMMAYSGIAQAGYLLVPFVPPTTLFFSEVIFYLFAYLLVSFGAFAVIMVVAQEQQTEDLKGFAGLYHRSPIMAVAMSIFLLSLAGIPVTAGFFGKFYLFMGALAQENYWLSAIMIVTSVISYYYYFGIIRQMYMRPGATEAQMRVPRGIWVFVLVMAVATVFFGAFPGLITDYVQTHFNPSFDFGNMLPPNFQ
ncbi:NADH-quinone oxidoreductase subunit N [Brevibacillus reuszeri]|uniref:NADH-quinone oxidoreductase subunit N n=1 Tax=Brevibacillus reuszeri TaxID=54915 RepID=A0A0K9YT89_9BACL|nr:NADH-quinone oxidoreductase subunit NuoN [Brevibacillus reuszeri]KNB71847.1 NADH:ubiquinone oxidoreductase subunit N [Brevibacillus reuszeri]MED1855321.1 NADH-quinone oxidoreductase subunit NuoN [Brevibacillus reuszeri]GED67528.1 NADH-quinone oxidoreductase subunit N [Brevibacillus reuszeri]